jgi:adenylyltransferase/sulfurtransferase
MLTTNVRELKAQIDSGKQPLILDVRDPHEWQISALEGTLRIPKGEIQMAKNAVLAGRKLREETVLADIPTDQEVIVMCRSGKRSADAIEMLKEIGYKDENLRNLTGGILAWAREIDPTMATY